MNYDIAVFVLKYMDLVTMEILQVTKGAKQMILQSFNVSPKY